MNEMKYILEELTSVDEFKDIEEMARLTKKIQKENEQTHYLPNLLHMGYQGFKLPDYDDYCDYIFSLVNEKDAKVFFARETCCSKKIIGACVGALTGKMFNGVRGGRVLFFWVHPDYRKSTLTNNMYKKMWGWFDKEKCSNVSITFKTWQEDILKYFMNKGYLINNVEVTGPVRFLEKA